ncbi:dual specificity mitogen-activated protein kinase kinase 3 isoform 3-T3 [Trichechus inunguis]
MELMDTSLDKFYRKVLDKNMTIPEDILGEIAVSIVRALEHLHSKLSVIHRDVKPSNVLINKEGHVKMCDFGISGYLVDSVAKTMDAGCKPYMAPERINPELNQKGYNVKSDVWSLGITMPEEEPHGAHELPGADGAPFLHLAQNQEDGHCCLREGDPGGGLVGVGPWTPPYPSEHLSPSAGAVLAHNHKLLPLGLRVPGGAGGLFPPDCAAGRLPRCQRTSPLGVPSQALGPLSLAVPLPLLLQGLPSPAPETLDSEGPGRSAEAPFQGSGHPHWTLLPLAACVDSRCTGPAPDATKLYIFLSLDKMDFAHFGPVWPYLLAHHR